MAKTQTLTTVSNSGEAPLQPAFISVIVPIRNEQAFIAQTLDGLLSQDYPRHAFEVLVVDGDSTDATLDVVGAYVAEHDTICLLSNPGRWSSRARNIGIDAAKGDLVVIVDGHCEFEDDQYLRNLDRAFRQPNIDCLGRPQPLDVSDGNLLQQAIAAARSSRLGHHPDSFIYSTHEQLVPAASVAVAYRKSVFETVGMFDEEFDACEDVELNHRIDKAGLRCLLAPDIRLRYHPRSSLSALFRQMMRYGRGRVRLMQKHPDTFSIKSMLPACFAAFAILGLLLVPLFPVMSPFYLGVMGLYVLIVFIVSTWLAIQHRRAAFWVMVPAVFAAIHFGAGYGSIKELVMGKTANDPLDR